MPKPLKSVDDIHIQRKLFHSLGLLTMLACMIWLPAWMCWLIYLTFCLPMVLLDWARFYFPGLKKAFIKVTQPVLRNYEVDRISGGTYALVAVPLVYGIYPKTIAELSVLFLAVGDPAASFFGLSFGKKKIWGHKSWAGFWGGFTVCMFASWIYLYGVHSAKLSPAFILIGLVLGTIAALSEVITLWKVDDNLSQPMISATLMSIFFYFQPELLI